MIAELAVDGYHAWYGLYNTVVGGMSVPFRKDGEVIRLSLGRAVNRKSHPDRSVRQRTFEGVQAAWDSVAPILADVLNHKAGFLLNLYRHRGWSDALQKSLESNRVTRATVDTMWEVVDQNKEVFAACLEHKARLLGVPRLSVYDLWAPLGRTGEKVTYEAAADTTVDSFARFSPDIGEFAQRAFAERWIEARDRPGTRPGSFCTSFPRSRRSLVFTTFDGDPVRVGIIAHELGHAYHDHAAGGMPYLLLQFRDSLLAKKHLGADLTQPEFWQRAIQADVADAREFLELTEW